MTDRPLDVLVDCLHRVRRGATLVVEVTGEPGIGRTRLLDEFAHVATAAGATLRRGAGAAALDEAFGDGFRAAVLARAARPVVVLLDDVPAGAAVRAELDGVRRVLAVITPRAPASPGADVRLVLGPLTEQEAAPLLAGLPPRRAAAVFARSGGNPLLLRLLAAAPGPAVPGPVIEAIGAEVDALPAAVRRLVRGAAVAGDPVDLALVAAAAGTAEPVDRDELLATGLFTAGDRLTFRRPVLAEAVYAAAGPAWRLAAHERVAAALAARGAPPVLRAPHLARCARPGDGDAVAQLVAAAAAEPSGPAAAGWYAAALRLQPETAPGRVELAAAHAVAVGTAGRLDDARRALRGLVEDGAVLPGAAAAFLAEANRLLGRRAAAPAAPLPGAEPADAAHLHLALADRASDTWAATGQDHAAALAHAVEAVVAARRSGDPLLALAAELATAAGELGMGRVAAATQAIAPARAAADELAVDDPARALSLLYRLSSIEERLELPEAGAEHARIALAIVERTERRHLEVRLRCTLSACLAALGRLADAAAELTHAEGMAGDQVAQDRLRAVATRLRVALAAGDLAGALDRCAALGATRAAPQVALHVAAVRLDAGDPGGCRDALAAGGPGLPGLARPDRPAAYELLTRAAIATGDVAAAAGWAERAELAVAGVTLPGRLAQARRARAEAELAGGNRPAAVAAARAAVELTASRPVDAGRSGVLLGRALIAVAEPDAAGAALDTAHALLVRCGARRAADEAAQLLRTLGHRTGRRPGGPATADPLSPREREVAELVAAGRTNRQIAATLFLSEKTVETHLSATFRKLSVRSRTALVAALRPR